MFKLFISFAIVVTGTCAFSQSAPQTAATAEDAAAVMQRVKEKIAAHTSAKGTLVLKGDKSAQQMEFTFSIMKPNFMNLVTSQFEMHGNGTDTVIYEPQQKMFIKLTPKIEKQGSPAALLIGLGGMFASDPAGGTSFQPQGKAKPGFFRGQKAIVVQLGGGNMGPLMLYINADTLTPIAFTSPDGKNSGIYKDLAFDAPMKAEDFAWTPPADAKSIEDMAKQGGAAGGGGEPGNAKLLKEGVAAPDFSLKTPTGGTLTLSKSLGKKATIVNFWADFCGPCHMEMPVFVKLYKELHAQGLELISIDEGDEAKVILKDIKDNNLNYLSAMNGKGALNMMDVYGVDAFPTNFILGPDGKIAAVVVGYDEDALKAALKKLGFEVK
jgi:thiol-disulfide isomerase/thioredoxin/outer membrane lipoprotein-sorting protein